ncbi:MAG: acyl-CoA dehydrogenase family protein [Gammaproteobacteria bacterium]|nr:acyl-CoA dehydrogenase family protein [Gammaproteobacteria bacterium]
MNFELDDEHQQLVHLVERFVADELVPLEPKLLAKEATGGESVLDHADLSRINAKAQALGLWGMDAPEEFGGTDLPHVAVTAVNMVLGRSITAYTFPPDSPNLRMLMVTANEAQRERYLAPYVRGETVSAMGISEPGAGADPRRMKTRAVRTDEGWRISGTKIWISKADKADFTIVMALTSAPNAERPEMSAFLVDQGLPGITVSSPIRMIGGSYTYEVAYDDVVVPEGALLGEEGTGFGPMQARLATRRLEIAAWCIGAAERALDMLMSHVKERVTFGVPLSDRQAVQWWIADGAAGIRACRLMAFEIAWRLDRGEDVSTLVSMIKVQATDMATQVIDNAMQAFGAMGTSKEMPLHLLAARVRLMRIYDGPTEIHRWVVARNLLRAH